MSTELLTTSPLFSSQKPHHQKKVKFTNSNNSDQFPNFSSSPSSPPSIPSGHLENSTKFWQFKVEEEMITYVRYGSIDYDGSLKERALHVQQHSCYLDAKKFIENLINEKTKAGYIGWINW
nr:1267_t:CDS:1 [Entrophospora candida]CAG8446449.1 11596_t:CDS:1 [Entrophospora candida]